MTPTRVWWIWMCYTTIGCFYILVASCVLFLSGCTLMLTEASPPETRQVIVPTSVEVTYQRATRAAAKLQGVLLEADPAQHTFTVQVKRVVGLHVDVRRVPEGTQLTVTGSMLPKQVALGMLTEVDEFLVAYWKEPV